MSLNFCDRKSFFDICKYYYVENLLRAFGYCCLFCISPRLYNSSIKLLASVRVSV